MSASARSAASHAGTAARARTSRSGGAARSGNQARATALRSSNWGGARPGAGRPRRGPIASEPHKPRPLLAARHPVHVVARLVRVTKSHARSSALGSTRTFTRGDLDRALRRALALSLGRTDFRIIHLAQRHDRVELLVEADDKLALARGMQGFQVSAAKALNLLAGRRGAVFPDRYRMRILRTRLEVRALVGSLPLGQCTDAWPQTWLLRIEGARSPAFGHARGLPRLRRWMRSRGDEDT